MAERSGSVTIKEVAQLAGVSIATVSRVLNHQHTVTPATRKRVVEAMQSLDYSRNEVARSLKTRKTRTIGIIAPELYNTFFMEMVVTMEQILATKGYSMIIGSSNDSVAEEQKKLQIFIERSVDGLVVIPAGAEGDHFNCKALTSIPLVLVDRKIGGLQADTVLVDNRYGVRKMIQALHAEGFTRIGYIGGEPTVYTAQERLEGFRVAMEEFDLPVEEQFLLLGKAMNQQAGRDLMQKALSYPNPPQAFFTANDLLHVGATTYALESLSSEKSKDLVIASFDHLSYAPLLKLCHYAVAQPMERIGEEVITLLLKRLSGDWEGFPEQVMLRPEIKILTAHGGRPFS